MPPLNNKSSIDNLCNATCASGLILVFTIIIGLLYVWANKCWRICSQCLPDSRSVLKVAEIKETNNEDSQSDDSLKMDDDVEDPVNQPVHSVKQEELQSARWRSLFSFTAHTHAIPLMIAVLLTIASGIVIPGLAYFLGKIFDSFTAFGANKLASNGLRQKVFHDCVALAGLGSASWLLNGGYFMFWLFFGELQARNVRDKLFNGMLDKDLEWFEMQQSGIGALLPRLQTYAFG